MGGERRGARFVIAVVILLLAPGVQAPNLVTGKKITPCSIPEGG
ncbi:hypothetical protein AB2863_23250, partial [Escherichia coli]